MSQFSADILEYEALRQLLGRYVSSPLGRAELEAMAPETSRARLDDMLVETAEALEYARAAGQPQTAGRGAAHRINFSGIPDLEQAVHKLRIEGASLDPKEIVDMLSLLDRAADAKSILTAVAGRFPRLGAYGGRIGDFRGLLREMEGKILPDGTVSDHASVLLGRLRRDIERQKRAIQESLERFLRAHRQEGVLQEEFVTIRNERFVVPVIAGQRRKLEGVIHGASASGHTLFVEPLETIDLNNELVRLTEEEGREVHRILLELTARLRGFSESIRESLAVMGRLEWLFAKARFGAEFDCAVPRFGSRVLVREARHPLLEDVLRRQQRKVVPLTLELGEKCKILLVSGPNTGGKTVTLKTVGLLALMAQSGLPVPAAEAEFPVFEQVLADIGDYQSIEASLSTFSAHIAHIRDMALRVTPDTLVLLDELGAATDPEEGGALGVAVLDHFRRAGAFTLASTHLLALKVYGANTDTVLNGSMGFDEETLEPTYLLHLGTPGQSAGLQIATRLGMPPAIMSRARQAMSTREQDLARFLAELHRRVAEVQELERTLVEERRRLKEREAEIARDWEKRESAKLKEMERRTEEVLARFDEQARATIGGIVQATRDRKAAERAERQVAKAKRELREELDATVLSTRDEARQGELRRPRVEEGARVRLRDVREPARVRRVLGNGRIEVEAGFMKLQVTVDDVIEVLPDAPAASRLPKNVTFRPAPELAPVAQEINVIGARAEEARDRVDAFLDQAYMATASRVRIVHGFGMGVLRKVVSGLLAAHPHVAKFYTAPQEEGGAGATIVELKD
ncbi:MAG: endonuclease MutS2 [Bryobacteraceae bacterium]